nr:hypothetical protein Iba_scaffold771840CG0010 [Ipomoea batatas]GMD49023.1 hypothetical protein Iba_chr10fCG11890 [Ipomoea batatas]GMD79875.1 hypothetical protein Iba_scaffold333922CG0010 [Ipomoea batatas]GME20727.1 hypothetical protein Iba_scaffold25938CG0020 [Ipomoea batatas]GME21726.1 hypothetical protein Iba_scaffold29005CG0030 [Ipomoea batatas]
MPICMLHDINSRRFNASCSAKLALMLAAFSINYGSYRRLLYVLFPRQLRHCKLALFIPANYAIVSVKRIRSSLRSHQMQMHC